ncbi:MAG: hypothetical protein WCY09_01370 [Candidatus Omnitrophota bacterium]
MKFSKLFFLSIIFCILTTLIGCSTFSDSRSGNPAMIEPQTNLKFADVPIPIGLKIIPQQSYSFESSGIRVGVLKYQGKADSDQIVNFYKEQMAMYNWNLINIVEYGVKLMNFDRENETCIINIEPKGNNVTLIIFLGPKSQNSPKKAKAPVK